jgi:DNA-binding NtrC family response regulator
MWMPKALLSVGSNQKLLGIRNLVLLRAGYRVVSARSGTGALEAIQSKQLDAVIIGHTVSHRLKQIIVEAAKRRCLPVVVLQKHPYQERIAAADANLCGIDGAVQIVEVLERLLS